jgi:two-component system, LytTR family, response regulator
MDKIKALIVDDSAQARKLLQLMLGEIAPEIEICALVESVIQAVDAIKQHQPDVVFLDIEMPGKSGLQLVDEISREEQPYEIIFTTAYNEYALNAFRLSAIDYLLKPIDESQLSNAVKRLTDKRDGESAKTRLNILKQNLSNNSENILSIPVQNGYEYIKLDEIEFLEADGSYVHVFSSDKKQKTVSKNLKYFQAILEKNSNFVRVHRSYIINLKNIHAFSRSGRGIITMKNGREIDLARDRRTEFLKILDKMGI